MLYDLSNDLDKRSFKTRVNALYQKGGIVELTDKKRRSLGQNRYFYLTLGWFGLQTGYTIEFVKQEYFKKLVNPDLFVKRVNADYVGEVETLRSSRDLNTEEMTLAIDRWRNWSSEVAGIYLPSPEDQALLEQMEYEISRNQRWL